MYMNSKHVTHFRSCQQYVNVLSSSRTNYFFFQPDTIKNTSTCWVFPEMLCCVTVKQADKMSVQVINAEKTKTRLPSWHIPDSNETQWSLSIKPAALTVHAHWVTDSHCQLYILYCYQHQLSECLLGINDFVLWVTSKHMWFAVLSLDCLSWDYKIVDSLCLHRWLHKLIYYNNWQLGDWPHCIHI